MLTKHQEEGHKLGVHLTFYVLQMARLIGLLFQPGWQLGGLQPLSQVLECCEENGRTEHKSKNTRCRANV